MYEDEWSSTSITLSSEGVDKKLSDKGECSEDIVKSALWFNSHEKDGDNHAIVLDAQTENITVSHTMPRRVLSDREWAESPRGEAALAHKLSQILTTLDNSKTREKLHQWIDTVVDNIEKQQKTMRDQLDMAIPALRAKKGGYPAPITSAVATEEEYRQQHNEILRLIAEHEQYILEHKQNRGSNAVLVALTAKEQQLRERSLPKKRRQPPRRMSIVGKVNKWRQDFESVQKKIFDNPTTTFPSRIPSPPNDKPPPSSGHSPLLNLRNGTLLKSGNRSARQIRQQPSGPATARGYRDPIIEENEISSPNHESSSRVISRPLSAHVPRAAFLPEGATDGITHDPALQQKHSNGTQNVKIALPARPQTRDGYLRSTFTGRKISKPLKRSDISIPIDRQWRTYGQLNEVIRKKDKENFNNRRIPIRTPEYSEKSNISQISSTRRPKTPREARIACAQRIAQNMNVIHNLDNDKPINFINRPLTPHQEISARIYAPCYTKIPEPPPTIPVSSNFGDFGQERVELMKKTCPLNTSSRIR